MTRSRTALVAAGIVLCSLCHWAMADAEADYKAVFGDEEAKAIGGSGKDAAVFAAKLLKAAKSVGEQIDLQALLCQKSYEFGVKDPSGYSTAVEAAKLLITAIPDQKEDSQDKLLKASQLRYARSTGTERKQFGKELVGLLVDCGDERLAAKKTADALARYRQALSLATATDSSRTREILDKIRQASSGQESDKKLDDLKEKLEANPKSITARTQLILAYLGEFDNPAEAARLVTPDLDEKYRTYVPMCAKPVAKLEEGVCLELAYWYEEIAQKAPPAGKNGLLIKAKACCERYLELHTAEDAARLKGTMLLLKLNAEPTPKLPETEINTLIIQGWVDGSSEIHVTAKGIYWKSLGVQKPGLTWFRNKNGKEIDEPTFVNGKPWMPTWHKQEERRGYDSTDMLPLPINKLGFSFAVLAVASNRDEKRIERRSPVTIRDGKDEQVIGISDREVGGRWYTIKLFRKKDQ